MEATSGKKIKCVVVTPERAVLDEPADFVALPMFDGELGVLPGRRAMIGRLGIGELRVKNGDRVKHLFIDGGFAQIRGDVVTVLTQKALSADEIKPDAVITEVEAASALPARTPHAMEEKARSQQRARVKQRIIGKPKHGHGGH